MDQTQQATRSRRIVFGLVPILAALAGAFVYHRYSILTGLDRVQGDPGDTRFVAFLLEHWNNALHGRADWRSPPMFYPVRGALAYSDSLVALGFVHALLRSALGVYQALNLQLILLSLSSFAAAYALFVRGFRLSLPGATAGAYFFAFSWPRFAQLVHVQLQFTTLLPLLLLLALECARDGRVLTRAQFAWRAGAFVALLALLLATTLYYAVFFALFLALAGAICLIGRSGRLHIAAVVRRQGAGLAGAAVLAAVLIGPVVAFYLPLMRESRGRQWSEVLPYLPRPIEMVWMGRENWVWGGLFARWPEALIVLRWPEHRIGVGLVATCAWICAGLWAATSLAFRRRRLDRWSAATCVVIVAGFLLQLAMLRMAGGASLWWAVWKAFPGANGIRAVTRLQLVATLPIALALGCMLDASLRPGRLRPLLAPLALALVAAVALEQLGRSPNYSGGQAEALSRRVGEAIPRACKAAYVIATPDLTMQPADVDEAHFDPKAYLAANPDVAAAWDATPWEHYARFGRSEHRYLDPETANRHLHLLFFYNFTIPLAAALSGVPVVNGYSGWEPPGWRLFDVLSPDARAHLSDWLALRGRPQDEVCVLPVRLQLDMLPDLPGEMWP